MIGVIGVFGWSSMIGVVGVGWSGWSFGGRRLIATAQVPVLVGTVSAVDYTVALEIVVYAGTVGTTEYVLGTAFREKR